MLAVLGIVIIAAILIGVGIGNKSQTASTPEGTTQPTTKATPPPTPKTATGQVEGRLGQPIELRNRVLTVNEVERNYSTGQPSSRPQLGNEFVRVNMTMENTASKDSFHFNPFQFKLEDSNGVQKPYTPVSQMPNTISASDISPGGVVTGNLVFQAPQGDSSLKLIYKPPGISGADITLG